MAGTLSRPRSPSWAVNSLSKTASPRAEASSSPRDSTSPRELNWLAKATSHPKFKDVLRSQVKDRRPPRKPTCLATLLTKIGSHSLRLCRIPLEIPPAISPLPEATPANVMLERLPLFDQCKSAFLQALVGICTRKEIQEPETSIDACGVGLPMLLLRSGRLQIQVGFDTPTRTVGPGSAINTAGMLGLQGARCEPGPFVYEPHVTTLPPPSQWSWGSIDEDADAPPPFMCQRRSVGGNQVLKQDALCFYNLCTYAAPPREVPGETGSQKPGADRLRRAQSSRFPPSMVKNPSAVALTTKSGGSNLLVPPPGAQPSFAAGEPGPDPPATSFQITTTGPASFLEVPADFRARLRAICEDPATTARVKEDLTAGIATYDRNLRALAKRWEFINAWAGRTMLGGAMPEMIWLLAELSCTDTVEPGGIIVVEGEVPVGDQPIIIICKGIAVVEKSTPQGDTAINQVIGRISVGAIIGDVCLLSLSVPWPASVRAETECEILIIPGACLLHFFDLVPGIVSSIVTRGNNLCKDLKSILPLPHEVLHSLQMFKDCDIEFLERLADSSSRSTRYCGEHVKEEGGVDESLYVVEFGRCYLEPGPRTPSRTINLGDSFGDLMFLGLTDTVPHTVRVISPFVILLEISKRYLHKHLVDFPHLLQHFQHMKHMSDTRTYGQWISRLEVFKNCSPEFNKAITDSVRMRLYAPSSTIVVTNTVDSCNMYGVKAGYVLAEVGDKVKNMKLGCTFGELTMLGLVRKRTATVRTRTFCFVLEIPRFTFLRAMTTYPHERHHFEELAMKQVQKSESVRWPMFQQAPPRLHILCNLLSGFSAKKPGQVCFRTNDTPDESILIVTGTASVLDANGQELRVLRPGSTYNEQVFMGMEACSDMSVVAADECEIQHLSTNHWERMLIEFPDEKARCEEFVLNYMVEESMRRKGMTPMDMIRGSVLFGACPEPFILAVCDQLRACVFPPGQVITRQHTTGTKAFFLIEGLVELEDRDRPPIQKQCRPEDVHGPAVVLGVTRLYSRTVTAVTNSVGLSLHSGKLRQMLQQQYSGADFMLQQLFGRTPRVSESLWCRVKLSNIFSSVPAKSLKLMCANGDDQFFRRGQTLLDVHSQGFLLVVLAGSVVVLAEHGVVIGELGVGCVIGHIQLPTCCLQTVEGVTTMQACASSELAHCAWLDAHDVCAAFDESPGEFQPLVDSFRRRDHLRQSFAAARQVWLDETALPTLVKIPIFKDFPNFLVREICTRLQETAYGPGDVITRAGRNADSMLILLQGTATAEVASGTMIGQLVDGSFLGEAAVMGLFKTRMVTLRATSPCSVVELHASVLREVLEHEQAAEHRDLLGKAVAQRRWQVARGLPIVCMPLRPNVEEPCVRVLALHAQHLVQPADKAWAPAPDDNPYGPFFAVMARGHARVEMEMEARFVTTVRAGEIVHEGLVADYNAYFRATSLCEVYRLREFDYQVALKTLPPTGPWFQEFQVLFKKHLDRLRTRLNAARGVVECLNQKPISNSIVTWSRARAVSIENAKRIKRTQGHNQSQIPFGQSPTRASRQGPSGSRSPSEIRQTACPAVGTRSKSLPLLANTRLRMPSREGREASASGSARTKSSPHLSSPSPKSQKHLSLNDPRFANRSPPPAAGVHCT